MEECLGCSWTCTPSKKKKKIKHVIHYFSLPSNFSTGRGDYQKLFNLALAPWYALSRAITTICCAVLSFSQTNARSQKTHLKKMAPLECAMLIYNYDYQAFEKYSNNRASKDYTDNGTH